MMALRAITYTAVLLALILACSREPTGSDFEDSQPIQPGTPIGADHVDRTITHLLWARDASEIYYYAAAEFPYSTLKAVRVADGNVRVIDPRLRYRCGLRRSRDGQAVLDFVADGSADPSPSVERIAVNGSSVDLLARDVQFTFRDGWPAAFAEHDAFYVYTRLGDPCQLKPGPAQGRASYCDTLFVQSGPGGEAVSLGPGDLITLSPDGSQVLFLAEPCDKVGPVRDCIAMFHRLSNGTAVPAGFTEWSEDWSSQYRWDDRGLRRLAIYRWEHDLLFIEDLVTHDSTTLHYFEGEPAPATYLADIAWSNDGRRVAFWALDLRLYVIDIGSPPRAVAAVTDDMEPGDIALSPDGRTLAYVAGNQIFVQDAEPD